MQSKQKISIALFSFTSCEGCVMETLNLFNEKFFELKNTYEFRHARVLKQKNSLESIDIAFVEGAISTQKELSKLKEIREKSKILIAIGGCGINGWPSTQRNNFEEQKKQEFGELIARFNQLQFIQTIPNSVKVDKLIQGCPIKREEFERTLKETTIELERT